MIVTSLLKEPPTVDIINTVKECVDQMTRDIVAHQDTYTKISTEIWETVKGPKDGIGGSGTSHK